MSDYDINGLNELEKNLKEMIDKKYPEELEKLVLQMGYELQGETKERTPRVTNRLRNGWRVGKIKRKGGEIYIEVYNNVEYAEPVEYGHRTGKSGYKEGVHMLEISMSLLQNKLNPFLKRWIDNFIRENDL